MILLLALTGCSSNVNDDISAIAQDEDTTIVETNSKITKKDFGLYNEVQTVELKWTDQTRFKEVVRYINVYLKNVSFDGKSLVFYTDIENGYGGNIKIPFDGQQIATVSIGGNQYSYSQSRFGEWTNVPKYSGTPERHEVLFGFETQENIIDLAEHEITIELKLALQVEGFEFENTGVTFNLRFNGSDGYTDEYVYEDPEVEIKYSKNGESNFSKYDKNKDGKIDKQEWEEYSKLYPADLNHDMFEHPIEKIIYELELSEEQPTFEELDKVFGGLTGSNLANLLNEEHGLYRKYYDMYSEMQIED